MSKNLMWGGRFSQGPSQIMEEINASIDFDQRLFSQDILGSKAHCEMLIKQGIISVSDGRIILDGLNQISGEIERGEFKFQRKFEDIHMNIEARLKTLVGDVAGRLHTARSRNDQVVTDFKLWTRDAIDSTIISLQELITVLIDQAEKYASLPLPGFTHLQIAQPITFGHYLLSFAEMLGRDMGRFEDTRKRLNECPLGAAALAGTSFPIDRHMTAEQLKFDRPTANSIDSVSSRDFACEFLASCAICSVNLSRLAEDLVLYTSDGFGFIRLSDGFTTGSSIMPQKRNADAAELIRGKPGKIIASLTNLLIILKGLPMAYGKDLQDDKLATFEAYDNLMLCLAAMTGMLDEMTVVPEKMADALNKGFPTATDLADWLVRELEIPFRDAHHITGSIVALAEDKNLLLSDVALEDMQAIEPMITVDVYDVLSISASLNSRKSYGGTAPECVLEAAIEARKRFFPS